MENRRNEIKSRFVRRGKTMRDWASENGFNPNTVGHVISGYRGTGGKRGKPSIINSAIKAALIRDGYWPAEEHATSQAAVN